MIPVNSSMYVSENTCRRGHTTPLRYFSNYGCVHCREMRARGEVLPSKMKTARQMAKKRGERYFDLGVDCPKGHGTIRLTVNGRCPKCVAERAKLRDDAYKQRNRNSKKLKYHVDAEYREVIKARRADYYAKVKDTDEFKEKKREKYKTQYEENPFSYAVRAMIRRGRKFNATPEWLTPAQRQDIEAYYKEAKRLTEATSIPHEVDHIVPLRHKEVCGLNVPWNLQILTQEENRSKWDNLPEEEDRICRSSHRTPRYVNVSWKRTLLTMR